MGASSSALMSHRSRLNKKGKTLLDEFVVQCSSVGMDDDQKFVAIKNKIEELLLSCALPAIRMIRFEDLASLKTFPRCPDNVNLTVELDSIDRNNSFLVFISHCWMRGYSGAEGWDGRPHPDNAAGDKYKLCIQGIDKLRRTLAPRMKDCFVWLDFGCINQDGNPAGELEQLDKIVQCCDCIFTPIVDKEPNWVLPTSYLNWYEHYQAKLWNDGPHAYLNRGWCRVEMLYAANIPVQENDERSDVKRHTMFESGLAYHCSKNRRPHFLYGTRESHHDVVPYLLPPLQHSYFTEYHPLKGNLSVAADREHIEALIAELQPYMDEMQITEGYRGDLNEAGEKHGHGVMKYENGDVYEGEWKNSLRQGKGLQNNADGTSYEGDWVDDKWHGEGPNRYPNGSWYKGQWEEGRKQGQGTVHFPDGGEYSGQWEADVIQGWGRCCSEGGDVYEGEWRAGLMEGQGRRSYAGGAGGVYEGQWRLGMREGHGRMTHSDGSCWEGEWRDDQPVF